MRRLPLLLLLLFLPAVNAMSLESLTTLFASDNQQDGPDAGFFFDLENVNIVSINIASWDINITCDNASTQISVYTRNGTSNGFQHTPDGWILVGTESGIVCAGINNPTPLSVGGIIINPGDLIGIAMVIDTDDATWRYSNGDTIFNNGDLELSPGSSATFSFVPNMGGTNFPRVWNGTVYYELQRDLTNVPTLSEWSLIVMAGLLGMAGLILVIRKRQVWA
jgi:hypothetical protein